MYVIVDLICISMSNQKVNKSSLLVTANKDPQLIKLLPSQELA